MQLYSVTFNFTSHPILAAALLALMLALAACGGGDAPEPVTPTEAPAPASTAPASSVGSTPASQPSGSAATPVPTPVVSTPVPPSANLSPEADRKALRALYDATDEFLLIDDAGQQVDSGWARSDNWMTDEPLSEWYGVVTDEAGRVTELNLRENHLTGELPRELGDLTELVVLDLGAGPQNPTFFNDHCHNLPHSRCGSLGGLVPPELGNLTKLEVLRLDFNFLVGTLPPQLGQLVNLRVLDLTANDFEGPVPPQWGNLSKLEELDLIIEGPLPPEIGGLTSLEYLNLYGITEEIPPEFWSLTSLETLRLGVHRAGRRYSHVEIPPEIGNLANLESLYLAGFSGEVPAELGNLANLETLIFAGDNMTGCVPANLKEQLDPQESGFGNLQYCEE